MRPNTAVSGLIFCTALTVATTLGLGQEGHEKEPSLGDLAREQRAKNEAAASKPVKVFTNDDLPSHPTPRTTPPAQTKKLAGNSGPGSPNAKEKYFRTRTAQLRTKLQQDKEFLAKLQHDLDRDCASDPRNAAPCVAAFESPRWVTNPVGAMQSQVSERQRLQSAVQRQQKKIAEDEQAISNLAEQCRREDCKPEWIR